MFTKMKTSLFARNNASLLPTKYEFLEKVGKGGFGKVLRCLDKETDNVVAIKIPLFKHSCRHEAVVLEYLMSKNLDRHNIVKFCDSFRVRHGKALVFENLELSIEDLIIQNNRPMMMADIRSTTKQVATALEALKSFGIIHIDIKIDNVMLVDQRQPFRVKLIDFGLAMDKSSASPGMALQTVPFRAPEIILGLPFSEAIDMWSVGCLLFPMIFNSFLFPADEYEALDIIIDILGQPPDELLEEGKRTHEFFKKTVFHTWRIKTPKEYYWAWRVPKDPIRHNFRTLDDLKQLSMKYNADAAEFEQCIDLMKAMLMVDQNERITPTGVLQHPFITRNTMTPTSPHSDQQSPPPNILPSGVNLDQPTASEDTLQLEEGETSVRVYTEDSETPSPPDDDNNINEEGAASASCRINKDPLFHHEHEEREESDMKQA